MADKVSNSFSTIGHPLPDYSRYSQSYPNTSRNQLPEEDEEAIEPVDGDHWLAMFDAFDNADCHLAGFELHREIAALDQWSLDESWTDVGDMDVTDASDTCQLAEAFKIMARETL